MSSTGRSKRVSRKKKGWNIKKKEEGVRKSIVGRGLPKKYIQQFGTPFEVTLISRNAWNQFYKSPAGKARAEKLVERYNKRMAEQDSYIRSTLSEGELNALRQTSEVGVIANYDANQTAKTAAKTK